MEMLGSLVSPSLITRLADAPVSDPAWIGDMQERVDVACSKARFHYKCQPGVGPGIFEAALTFLGWLACRGVAD